ncbi:hypothetical protein AC579_7012 [Pseudocercospora musae]|uniref:Uncharacterized protein n=1 Tax=Pseudocercospora musae TaxID=113226 RepID=A0A139HDH2_9PEZI|nr:hypothetical protein AC579_7012 [Pseudocercospora musae]
MNVPQALGQKEMKLAEQVNGQKEMKLSEQANGQKEMKLSEQANGQQKYGAHHATQSALKDDSKTHVLHRRLKSLNDQ